MITLLIKPVTFLKLAIFAQHFFDEHVANLVVMRINNLFCMLKKNNLVLVLKFS